MVAGERLRRKRSSPAAADPIMVVMRWPAPTARTMRLLHAASAAPLVALAGWFGLVDSPATGAGRCAGCGVEGWVTGAHVAAAAWLALVIAATAAARRGSSPGPITTRALAAVALFVAAALAWHPLMTVPAVAAMAASVLLLPLAALWWLARAVAWLRGTPRASQLGSSLVAAWFGLVVLLPAIYGWVWADRVDWLVF
jgi:hypothetical protein